MAAGWFPDPSARHAYRYYDGSAWTAHVADNGVQSVDSRAPEPPQQGPGESMQQFSAWSDDRMRAAAVWWSHRRRQERDAPTGPQILSDTGPVSVLGEWSGLADAVTHYAVSATGIAGATDVLGLLHAISGAADAQSVLLRRIDTKVDALVLGPYQTGRTHLNEAARVGAADSTQLEHINEAKDCFYLAHGQAASVQSRALVEYHLGASWLLLGRPSDAMYWFVQSYGSAVTVVQELARNAEDIKVLNSRASTAAASYFYPAGVVVMGMKFKKMLAAEQSMETLREFLPFVACVARSLNALAAPDAHVPAMRLTGGGNGHELVDVDV